MYLIVYTIFTIVVIVLCNYSLSLTYVSWLPFVNMLFLSQLLLQLFISKKVFGRFLNISVVLLVFTYLFNLSYPFVLRFGNQDYVDQVNYRIRHFNDTDFQLMIYYSIIYIALLFWGMLLYEYSRKKFPVIVKYDDGIAINYRAIGITMIVVALPIDIIFMYIRVKAMILGGYGEALATAVEGKYYASFFSFLIITGVFLLIKSSKKNKQNKYVIAYCLYEIIWMFSGQRATPMICIIVLICLRWGFGQSIRLKYIIQMALAGAFVLILLNLIRELREYGFDSFRFADLYSFNILFDSMVEFGYTVNIFGYVINDSGQHVIGSSLLFDIVHIIPKISTFNLDLSNVNIYEDLDLYDKGASYLAEILYDFKQYGFVVIVLYGIYVRWLDCKFEHLIISGNYLKVLKYISLAVVTIFCVRTGLVNLFRTFIYTWILITMVTSFRFKLRK